MIAVAIPDMAKSLGEHPLRLNLVITSYLLSLAVFIPLSGWIADRLGARVVFCAAIAIFAAGSALCGLSTSLPMMLVMRVVQGFGGAMMTPVGRLILLRSFPRSGLVSAMNWMTIPAMIGPTVGPIVGGFLTTYFSWHAIFFLNLPIGVIGVVLALYLIDNFRAPAPTPLDLRGFVIAGSLPASGSVSSNSPSNISGARSFPRDSACCFFRRHSPSWRSTSGMPGSAKIRSSICGSYASVPFASAP
jgi:MFS family permease